MTALTLFFAALSVCCIALYFFPYFSTYVMGPGMMLFVLMLTITKAKPETVSFSRFVGVNPENVLQSLMIFLLSYGLVLGLVTILGGALRIELIERMTKKCGNG